jgi:hypothetical protein
MVVILLYAIALLTTPFTLLLQRRLLPLRRPRGLLALGLGIAAALIAAFFWLIYQGLLVAIPVAILMYNIIIISGAYRWAVADAMERYSEKLIASRPDLESHFRTNPILRRVRKDRG